MGEQIEFPKNFNMYMSQVMSQLREGNVEKATEYMKKAYAIKEEDSLSVLLVSSLLQTGKYKEALERANEKIGFYESDEKRLMIFVEVLLENNQILQAGKYINDALESQTTKYTDSWNRLEERLDKIKHEQEESRRKAEERVVKQLYSLASLNTQEQFSQMADIYILPNDKLKGVAPQLFSNPYVHPLVRATLLSLLSERAVDEQYTYQWFDETKVVNPVEVWPIDNNPTVNRLITVMNENLSQNPSLYQLVKNEVDTVLLMLYPFEGEIIKNNNIEEWVQTIIEGIEPDSAVQDVKNENLRKYMTNWVKKIHSELLRFE